MAQDSAHIHFDHVGSLLRPAALFEARKRILGLHDADHNLGAHENAELAAIEDKHIRDVVALQEGAGMPVVTDGEFRRRSWWTDFYLSLTGTSITYNGKQPITFINAAGETRPAPAIRIRGKVAWQHSVNVDAFNFLQSATKRVAKVTLPGPPMLHFMRDENFVPAAYPDLDQFWDDVIAAYRREIAALAAAGCRHIQIDECMMPMLCDPRHQAFVRTRGEDPADLMKKYAWAINQGIAGRPKDMVVALHTCRGNLNAFWGADGGYQPIADLIFNQIDADLYLLEYDTQRAGDFRPLRQVPKGKTVLLGLISTKENVLEARDMLMRRIEEAGQHIDHEQLGLCPQCGFSTNVFGTHFTIDDQRRKLELVAEIAGEAWH
jgi:5-methyltetrahydropteroyltriglutamate--homocysteine methyltransferase